MTEKAKSYCEKIFGSEGFGLDKTDPEFSDFFQNFVFDEVVNSDELDDRTRMMAILAALMGCQGIDTFEIMLPASLNAGVTPVEVKEIVYQGAAYLGIGRVLPFINKVNAIFEKKGISIPLSGQATIGRGERIEKGEQAQVDIFGDGMKGFATSGPEESRHINRWLSGNCFGDYYTRSGLDYRQREMITFCFLLAQGGCEPQLISHAAGNMKVGNDKVFLIHIISQCLPYIGYPRSLNGLRCVNEAAKDA